MKRSMSIICAFFLLCVIAVSSHSRPFDWNYNYLSTPFAIFYNPSLLGNNAGYTFGIDGRYVDSSDYDARMAFVVPVSKMELADSYSSGGGYLKYANTSHRSSRYAVSVGGAYNSDEDYNVTAGFTAPLFQLQSGASIDYSRLGNNDPVVSVDAGLSANVIDRMVYFAAHNIWASERDAENLFGLSLGVAALLYSNPYVVLIPIEAAVTSFFADDLGYVENVNATFRLTVDFTPLLIGRDRTGVTAAVSGGFSRITRYDLPNENRVFASLTAVFMGRSSSLAALGGYGRGRDRDDAYHGGAVYNMFREGGAGIFAGADFSAALRHSVTDDGKILFHLDSRGVNVDNWVLRIDAQNSRSVKTFSGGNVIPTTILWDVTNSLGETVDEPVRAKLVVMGRNDTVVESEWVSVVPDKKISKNHNHVKEQ